jgi:hypothetical protein
MTSLHTSAVICLVIEICSEHKSKQNRWRGARRDHFNHTRRGSDRSFHLD